jgi:hypothetical protein
VTQVIHPCWPVKKAVKNQTNKKGGNMPKPTDEAGSDVQVTIVLEDAIVKCTPACAYLRRGQTIEWICQGNFPFAIHMGYDTPFEKEHYQAPPRQSIRLSIAPSHRYGRYKYTVAVFDGENVWIEDPELIIRR